MKESEKFSWGLIVSPRENVHKLNVFKVISIICESQFKKEKNCTTLPLFHITKQFEHSHKLKSLEINILFKVKYFQCSYLLKNKKLN